MQRVPPAPPMPITPLKPNDGRPVPAERPRGTRVPRSHDDRCALPSADDETDEQISVGDSAIGKTRLLSRQCPTCVFRPWPPDAHDPDPAAAIRRTGMRHQRATPSAIPSGYYGNEAR
jgi:hypothetical protein